MKANPQLPNLNLLGRLSPEERAEFECFKADMKPVDSNGSAISSYATPKAGVALSFRTTQDMLDMTPLVADMPKRGRGRPKKDEGLSLGNEIYDPTTEGLYLEYLTTKQTYINPLLGLEYNKLENWDNYIKFIVDMATSTMILFPNENYCRLIRSFLFISPSISFNIYPLSERYFVSQISRYLVSEKFVCFDTAHQVYTLDVNNALFTRILKPGQLDTYISHFVDLINNSMNLIFHTMTTLFSSRRHFNRIGRAVAQETLKTLNIFWKNRTEFQRITKSISVKVMGNIFNNLSSLGIQEFQESNTIKFLSEGGLPGYIPFRNKWVYNLAGRKFEPREPYHAFTSDSKMLSMEYTKEEVEPWIGIPYTYYYNVDNVRYQATGYKWRYFNCLFDEVLSSIANDNLEIMIKLQFFIGCCLSGTPTKAIFFFYSRHFDSGKSLVGKLVRFLLGSMAESADCGLIIDTGARTSHQSEKSFIHGLWAVFIDEMPPEYVFNKDVQLITSGEANEIASRAAFGTVKLRSLLTATIGALTNYLTLKSMRGVVIPFPTGFSPDPENGPWHPTWMKNQRTQELIHELKLPGAIRQKDPQMYTKITNDSRERFFFLIRCIQFAEERIHRDMEMCKSLIVVNEKFNDLPVTIECFFNAAEDERDAALNPYTQQADETDKNLKTDNLVKFAEYYQSYEKFVRNVFPTDIRAVGRDKFRQVLEDKELLLYGTDRVKFYLPTVAKGLNKANFQELFPRLFAPLPDDAATSQGIKMEVYYTTIEEALKKANEQIEKQTYPGQWVDGKFYQVERFHVYTRPEILALTKKWYPQYYAKSNVMHMRVFKI